MERLRRAAPEQFHEHQRADDVMAAAGGGGIRGRDRVCERGQPASRARHGARARDGDPRIARRQPRTDDPPGAHRKPRARGRWGASGYPVGRVAPRWAARGVPAWDAAVGGRPALERARPLVRRADDDRVRAVVRVGAGVAGEPDRSERDVEAERTHVGRQRPSPAAPGPRARRARAGGHLARGRRPGDPQLLESYAGRSGHSDGAHADVLAAGDAGAVRVRENGSKPSTGCCSSACAPYRA